ncbi:MAG: hypothetical protein WBA41_20345 [Rivularia sp. (in: cyanobacteria)]
MKLKKLSLLAGAIAVAFSITPLAANAQVNSDAPQKISQARPPSASDLELNQEQMTQINKILADRSRQMQATLTAAQRDKIKKDLEAGKNPQQVLSEVKFSPEQEKQLRNIMVTSQRGIEALLTPEQMKKIQEWRATQGRQGTPQKKK